MVKNKKEKLLKIDLGAGKGANTPDGFIKVDINPFKDVKVVDLRKRWPWRSNSVDEAQANYLVHYLTASERIHFVNELYRVLKPDAKALLITPYWSAGKAYGDLSAQWPAVVEAWFPNLSAEQRAKSNQVMNGYHCDFEFTLGYGLHPLIVTRQIEYQQHAVAFWKEAAQDLIVTLVKK